MSALRNILTNNTTHSIFSTITIDLTTKSLQPSVPSVAVRIQKVKPVVAAAVALGEESAAMGARERSTLGGKGLRPANVRAQLSVIEFLDWVCMHRLEWHHHFAMFSLLDCVHTPLIAESVTVTIATKTLSTPGSGVATPVKCPKCGFSPKDQRSCCAPGGSWRGKCGNDDDGMEHTWTEGQLVCEGRHPIHYAHHFFH